MDIYWLKKLATADPGPVHLLESGGYLFTGASGQLYKQEAVTGHIVHSNVLLGANVYEVRLSLKADQLAVGTHGHVLCLHATDLLTIWRARLPGIDANPVTVLADGEAIYAGSQSCAYKLDGTDGSILNSRALSAGASGEVTLLIAFGMLIAGSNGHMYAMDLSDLSIKWSVELTTQGNLDVALAADAAAPPVLRLLYAAVGGAVYVISPEEGKQVGHFSLPLVSGFQQMHMMIGGNAVLYVATESFVVALKPGLETLSLLGAKVLEEGTAYPVHLLYYGTKTAQLCAGTNGVIYLMDAFLQDPVNKVLLPKEVGAYTIRFAPSAGIVLAGSYGYACYLGTPP